MRRPSSRCRQVRSARGAPSNPIRLRSTDVATDSGSQTARVTTNEGVGMKIVRGDFSVEHTSSKSPNVILDEVVRVLSLQRIPHAKTGSYEVTCQKQNTRFKIELCRLEKVQRVFIVRLQRLAGDAWSYKE